MNRNDVVRSVTGSDVAKASKVPVVSPRQSPRMFDAASSYKRSPRQPKSAGSTIGRPTFPKGALLEEKSVHLPMPSFHDRNHSTLGWECAGCGSVNQSALSNECSLCGMLRSVDFDVSDVSESMAGDDEESFSSMFDGNASEASLSHHNFSILDKQPEMVDRQLVDRQQRGHMSMPVMQSSFSSIASQQTTRTALNRRPVHTSSLRDRAAGLDDDGSVISFRNWNGNKKVKPWECGACTFINDNPLHLVCEMCGNRRDELPPGTDTAASAAHIPLDQSTTEEEEDHELDLLRTEQIRELIDIQRDIMSNFGTRANTSLSSIHNAEESKFNTSDLQREVADLQASIAPRLDYNDIDGTEYELERVKEVIRAQQEIMIDFKRKRAVEHPDRMEKRTSVPSSLLSPSSQKASASADSLFGVSNQPNTTPNHFLKGSMKAARGMLRQEDLVLPILWGDDLGKAEKKAGSGGSVASRNSGGSKR